MMSNELKPCPFCGGEATVTICGYEAGCIICKECGCQSNIGNDVEKFKTAWNTRATPPNPPLTLEQLKERVGKPVYVVSLRKRFKNQWAIAQGNLGYISGDSLLLEDFESNYSVGWLAYDHEPKGE